MKGFPPDNAPQLLPADADGWYELRVGLPRPDWTKTRQWIDDHVSKSQHDLAWYQAACDWLERLGTALGSQYVVHESPLVLVLTSDPDDQAEAMLLLLEKERKRINLLLGEAACQDYMGKLTAIVFADKAAYRSFMSDEYQSDAYVGQKGALFVPVADGPMVLRPRDEGQIDSRVAYETIGNCLMHLPLPRWLNGGVQSMLSESPYYSFDNWRAIGGPRGGIDPTIRIRKNLNETIQQFWSGEAWWSPDVDFRRFCLILAAELTRKLSRRRGFNYFVLKAEAKDAGQAAAEGLGVDLGEAVAEFFGPGDWRPRPETWKSHESETKPNA